MNAAAFNSAFLAALSIQAQNQILDAIARHYGISREEAKDEILDEEAEMVLEYMVGAERAAASVLMQRVGFRAAA